MVFIDVIYSFHDRISSDTIGMGTNNFRRHPANRSIHPEIGLHRGPRKKNKGDNRIAKCLQIYKRIRGKKKNGNHRPPLAGTGRTASNMVKRGIFNASKKKVYCKRNRYCFDILIFRTFFLAYFLKWKL